jgi:hypothetical protein
MAKLALLPLTADLFLEFSKVCKDGPPRRLVVKENPLPDDAKIISIEAFWDRPPFTLALLLTSEAFADVPEGQTPPEVPDIWFETVYDEVTASVA